MQRNKPIRLALVLGLVVSVLIWNTSARTVALRRTTSGGWLSVWANRCMDRGYEVRDFRFTDRIDLRLWSGCQMNITVELPRSSLIVLREHRWIGGKRGVYINLRLREQQDSSVVEDDAKIIYDFETAQFYMTSPLHLWRRPGEGHKAWLSDEEFQAVLRSLEGMAKSRSL